MGAMECLARDMVPTNLRDIAAAVMINKPTDKLLTDHPVGILEHSSIHQEDNTLLHLHPMVYLRWSPLSFQNGNLQLLRMVKFTTTMRDLERPLGRSLLGCCKNNLLT
jgi:hypothetical protein